MNTLGHEESHVLYSCLRVFKKRVANVGEVLKTLTRLHFDGLLSLVGDVRFYDAE